MLILCNILALYLLTKRYAYTNSCVAVKMHFPSLFSFLLDILIRIDTVCASALRTIDGRVFKIDFTFVSAFGSLWSKGGIYQNWSKEWRAKEKETNEC